MTSYAEHITHLQTTWEQGLANAQLDGAVIAAGQQQTYFQDDLTVPFRANPNFAHFLPGADNPDSYVVVRPGERPVALWFAPRDYWHAAPELPVWCEEAVDLEVFDDTEVLANRLQALINPLGRVTLIGAEAPSNLGNMSHNDETLLNYLHWHRARKTPHEIELMRAASAQAVRGHVAAKEAFDAGGSEFEIHCAYLAASGQHAPELPYSSIVALNEHAAVLHYQYYDRQPPDRHRSFLIDAGGRVSSYAADITRTYAAADETAFAELVAAFDAEQQSLVAQVRPGISFVDLHTAAHEAVARVLAASGLATGSAESLFESGVTETFLPHGLGHLIGLQTHDVAGHQADERGGTKPPPTAYPALRFTRDLDVGQLFTIEPGLYFIPMLLDELRADARGKQINWSAIEPLQGCGGIRIEDNVCVTETGCENLTREAFAVIGADV